ncbi:MAG TPA: hypothetical protein VGR68_05780, partial [Actinomycetota bacterium]|nr:hypothetical protein [Actinomycetota bacterium]
MSEASAETTVRLGPAVANLLRSIWRQRELVVLGLLLGLALGYWGLPKVLNTGSTYDVTVRMSVQKSPADSIFEIVPAIGGPDGQVGASTDVLKDIAIADRVAKSLREQDPELTGTILLEGLTFTAVPGSPFVDITYADPDPRLATTIVQRYAELYAEQRNKVEMQRLDQALMRLKVYATTLQGVDRQAVNEVIRKSEVAKLRGPVTAVVGQPIVTTTGPPLSRPVTLALGLLLGLAIGAGAALLVETAFRKVITPTDAEEGSELP